MNTEITIRYYCLQAAVSKLPEGAKSTTVTTYAEDLFNWILKPLMQEQKVQGEVSES